jgi:uncharacterized hydrophobic protein (TIGR00271 family)
MTRGNQESDLPESGRATQKNACSPDEISLDPKGFVDRGSTLLKQVLNLREGMDVEGTIAGIKKDIDVKGHTVWILTCAIFIACIGLNVNSTAVIIGAMLISPLMSSILGIGLAIGTNDWSTLIRSLRSFGVAVGVSLLTSFVYFLLSPLQELQPELVARTKPTILDVFLAIFGGMAGIIASSRKEKTNVVPGVAIATALMPPLCTAGFGLASGNWAFFFGAFYLFVLNSVFICITTVVFVRSLDFPSVCFVNPATEKKVKRYIITFALIVIVPSGWLFWGVVKESYFRNRALAFVEEKANFTDCEVINKRMTYDDTICTIDLFLIGEIVSDEVEIRLNAQLAGYDLKDNFLVSQTVIKLHQTKGAPAEARPSTSFSGLGSFSLARAMNADFRVDGKGSAPYRSATLTPSPNPTAGNEALCGPPPRRLVPADLSPLAGHPAFKAHGESPPAPFRSRAPPSAP